MPYSLKQTTQLTREVLGLIIPRATLYVPNIVGLFGGGGGRYNLTTLAQGAITKQSVAQVLVAVYRVIVIL